jgi:hypothetical protein
MLPPSMGEGRQYLCSSTPPRMRNRATLGIYFRTYRSSCGTWLVVTAPVPNMHPVIGFESKSMACAAELPPVNAARPVSYP